MRCNPHRQRTRKGGPNRVPNSFRLLTGSGLTVILAILIALSVSSVAMAADATATQTRVSVWPEYDDPRVLVILQADLTDDTDLPTTVSFNLPKGAEIGMACEVSPSDAHSCKPYELEDKGDYQTPSYTVDTQRKVFLEYYYEAFPAGAGDRDFAVDFRPEFPAGTVTFEVQQPARATNFTLDPEFPQQSTDSQGLTHFSTQIADVPLGEVESVSIAYSKADAEPSVKPADNSAGGAAELPLGQAAANNSLLVVAAAIGFAVLLFVGYRSFRPSHVGGGSRRARSKGTGGGAPSEPRGKKGRNKTASKATGGFCTQCGEGVDSEDRFCHGCGNPVGN